MPQHIASGLMKVIFKILFFLTLCFATASTSAQAIKVSLLRTGPGVAFFTGSNAASSVPAFGFNIGAAPTVQLSEWFYLKPEIAIAKKGGRLDYVSPGIYSGSVKYRIYYIDCPIMIGANLSRRLSIEAGGYSAVKLGANFNFEGTFAGGYGTFAGDALKSVDYGLACGITFKARILHIGLRYTHGLTPVIQDSGHNSAAPLLGSAVNNTVQLTIQKVHFRGRKRI